MPNFQIDAADTLFFRDGRPFTMGEDTYAESITFPPMPSVIYGTLRTTFLAQNQSRFSVNALIGKTADLVVKNIALKASDDNVYFPMPKDLVVSKDNGRTEIEALQLSEQSVISNLKTLQFLYRNTSKKVEEEDFVLMNTVLQDYLDGNSDALTFAKLNDFLVKETKLGIGRNNDTRISSDGLLYRVGMIRPQVIDDKNRVKSMGIAVEFDDLSGLSANANNWVQLGGEKKVAFLNVNTEPLSMTYPEIDSTMFKIYLATPAIFKDGSFPKALLRKHNLELITAAVGKPINVGGWDVVKGKPKPMLKAVPAGSVYYVKAQSIELAQKAARDIHEQHAISDYADSAKQGFGIAFIGKTLNSNV